LWGTIVSLLDALTHGGIGARKRVGVGSTINGSSSVVKTHRREEKCQRVLQPAEKARSEISLRNRKADKKKKKLHIRSAPTAAERAKRKYPGESI